MIDGKHVICVFGSSHPAEGSEEYMTALHLGRSLAQAGFHVCNGAYGGTMEASARGAKEGGGTTLGIVLRHAPEPNRWIDNTIVAETLIDRLATLIRTGDGYVVLRGGTGTLLELSAVWEFMNKRAIVPKPVVVLGWEELLRALRSTFISEGQSGALELVSSARSVEECVSLFINSFRMRNEI